MASKPEKCSSLIAEENHQKVISIDIRLRVLPGVGHVPDKASRRPVYDFGNDDTIGFY